MRASRGRACPGLGRGTERPGYPLPAASAGQKAPGGRRFDRGLRHRSPRSLPPRAVPRVPTVPVRDLSLRRRSRDPPSVGPAPPACRTPVGAPPKRGGSVRLKGRHGSRLRPPGPARGAGLDASTLVAGNGRAGRERGCGRRSRSSVASVPFAAPRVKARGRLGGPGAHRDGGAPPGLLRHHARQPAQGLGTLPK